MRKLALALCCMLILSACTAPPPPSSSPASSSETNAANSVVEKEPAPVAIDWATQADAITQQLAAYSIDNTAIDSPVDTLTTLGINSFILTVPLNESPSYLYKDFVSHTPDGSYQYPADRVQQIAYELFGKERWTLEGGDTSYDEATKCYTTGLEFGIGHGLVCENVTSSIAPDGNTVVSTFQLANPMASDPEKSSDPVYKVYGNYQVTYTVMEEKGHGFLRFVSMAKAG